MYVCLSSALESLPAIFETSRILAEWMVGVSFWEIRGGDIHLDGSTGLALVHSIRGCLVNKNHIHVYNYRQCDKQDQRGMFGTLYKPIS